MPQNFRTIDPNRNEPITIGELELIEAIERANKTLVGINTNFKFSIHEDTKAIMVKVINSETQEVIREIPPEKILDMVAKMWELAGLIVDRHI
ncbi:MAG TPA: flagellar protein FlaG [Clostridiales bacterium]|nr:flagellar protein FlaG [Clostridiales bacterium]